MNNVLLSKAKKQIEARLQWGDSEGWTNQDFLALTKKIHDELHVQLSHVTLKRLWGKVKYDHSPNAFTLDTLVQFVGYENWQDFKTKNQNAVDGQPEVKERAAPDFRRWWAAAAVLILLGVAGMGARVFSKWESSDGKGGYSLSVRKVLPKGVPNSVIFDYDASNAPGDSVVLQQSWDIRRRTAVPKDEHTRTLIYYLPGYFEAKLVVADKVVKEQGILIETDGWLATIDKAPMPVYFRKKDFIKNGNMALPLEKITAQNVSLAPEAPLLSYLNVRDFGEIYSDDFIFETSVRNDFNEGSSICQQSTVYLLCEGTAIAIPLCAKGCVSDASFFFTTFVAPGKETDLSSFGVTFDHFVNIRVESAKGKARIFVDGTLAFEVPHSIMRSKIIGMDFVFKGTGSVDYARLSNKTSRIQEDF